MGKSSGSQTMDLTGSSNSYKGSTNPYILKAWASERVCLVHSLYIVLFKHIKMLL